MHSLNVCASREVRRTDSEPVCAQTKLCMFQMLSFKRVRGSLIGKGASLGMNMLEMYKNATGMFPLATDRGY